METDPQASGQITPQQQFPQNSTPPRNHNLISSFSTPSPMDNAAGALAADTPHVEEEGGSRRSGLTFTNIVSLSRPENAQAPPAIPVEDIPVEDYRRALEASLGIPHYPGDDVYIKLEPNTTPLDVARRTTLDSEWILEDRALQIVTSDELTTNIVDDIVEKFVRLDGDVTPPQRAHEHINGGEGVRAGFLCGTSGERNRLAAALKKGLELSAVDTTLFAPDSRQGGAILEAANSIRYKLDEQDDTSIGGRVSLVPGVELAGIVKDNQNLNFMPGEGPRKVIFQIASADTPTAEAINAMEQISLATPGKKSPASSAKDGARIGGKVKRINIGSGVAAAARKKKHLKKIKENQL